MNEKDRYENRPLYVALTSLLKKHGLLWVTVRRGREGYGKRREIKIRSLSVFRRNDPLILECIDETAEIERILPLVNHMAKGKLWIVEDGDLWN